MKMIRQIVWGHRTSLGVLYILHRGSRQWASTLVTDHAYHCLKIWLFMSAWDGVWVKPQGEYFHVKDLQYTLKFKLEGLPSRHILPPWTLTRIIDVVFVLFCHLLCVLGLKDLWGCWVWVVSRHAGKLYQELPFLGSRRSVLGLATLLPRLDNRWFMVFNSRHEPKPFVFYCVWSGSGAHIA